MIKVELPDKSIKEVAENTIPLEIASQISKSLANNAVVAMVDGVLFDLNLPLKTDCSLKIITKEQKEGLDVIRHDAAHTLAQAVLELYPDAKLGVGPVIENGFYYDICTKSTISVDDLPKIEKKMQEIVQKAYPIVRKELKRNEAIEFFKSKGENFKVELISKIAKDQTISVYKQGNFVDLCKGPHSLNTGKVKHFKLLKTSGAYWLGDAKNQSMQRIYGTAWTTKKELEDYLEFLEEVKKRDHRKIGQDMSLFHIQEEAKGQVFWHERGLKIYKIIENYLRERLDQNDYKEVKTPLILDKSLWEKSGHWAKFKDDMFAINDQEKKEAFAIKPMNCPAHIQIFNQGTKSYRDLPLKMSEFGMCHRNEASGGLHGLMRVRGFVQDDAHIFCTEEQIEKETQSFCSLLQDVYKDFGFSDIKVKFSDRPEARIGDDATWDKAEDALKKAVESAGLNYDLNPGEGAFYGPKIEFVLKDAVGRNWQCGTLQVDFMLPKRLDAFYTDINGKKKNPVMLHRAVLGTFERFIGILIEHYKGNFPVWLAPIQICVATITDAAKDYAKGLFEQLKKHKMRTILDISAKKIDYKVRSYSLQKIPVMLIVGKQEMQNNSVSVRRIGNKNTKNQSFNDFLKEFITEIANRRF